MKDLRDLFAPQANVKSLHDLYDPYDNLPVTLKLAARKAVRLKERILKDANEKLDHPHSRGLPLFPFKLNRFEYIGPSADDYLKPFSEKDFNFSLGLKHCQPDGIQEMVVPFSLSEMSALHKAYPLNRQIRAEIRSVLRPFIQETEFCAAFTRAVLADAAYGESQLCLDRVRRGGGLGRDL